MVIGVMDQDECWGQFPKKLYLKTNYDKLKTMELIFLYSFKDTAP